MVMDSETPCGVVFETFKTFAGISNRDLASVILSDKPLAGGRSPRQRVDDKSYLSRMIVHSKPGDLPPAAFVGFPQSAHTLFSMMRSAGLSTDTIMSQFCGMAAQAMAKSCHAYGLNDALYLNTVNRLVVAEGVSEADRAYLLVLLFLEAGCRQDTRAAAEHVLTVLESEFNVHPMTQATQSFDRVTPEKIEDTRLALFRVVGNRMRGHAYVLSIGPEGTEIGYLSTSSDSITDVEETVSRRHLLLYRAEDGTWFARGLNSRNGTVLVSGEDRTETVIEPPRDKADGFQRLDVRIQPGDKLKLARDTVFMVVQIDPDSL